jgi:hypothetical protein
MEKKNGSKSNRKNIMSPMKRSKPVDKYCLFVGLNDAKVQVISAPVSIISKGQVIL